MFNKNILFIVQNQAQAVNAVRLSQDLKKLDIRYSCSAIWLDRCMGKAFAHEYKQVLPGITVPYDLTGGRPFYRQTWIKRLYTVFKYRKWLKANAITGDVVIIGNDGAFQRATVDFLNSTRKRALAVLLQEGLLDNRFTCISYLKTLIIRILTKFHMSSYFPSVNGAYPVDRVISFDKAWLESSFVKYFHHDRRWRLMPRQESLLSGFSKKQTCNLTKNILYITSAYRWHRKYKEALLQEQEIVSLIQWAMRQSNVNLRIRLHPHEPIDDWITIIPKDVKDVVELTSSDRELSEDLAWCDVVISARSTVLIDAYYAGYDVRGTAVMFPRVTKRDSLYNYPIFWITSWDQILDNCETRDIVYPQVVTASDILFDLPA